MTLLIFLLLATGLHDEADYKTAAGLYKDFEYEQALLIFEQLSVSTSFSPGEQAEVILWTALCAEGMGDTARADRLMKAALAKDVEVSLPVKVSPATAERFEALRFDLKKALGSSTGSGPPVSTPAQDGAGGAASTASATLPVLPIALGSVGAIALVAGGVLALVAGDRYGAAQNTKLFVDERVAAHGQYLGAVVGASAVGVVGAGLAGAAVFLAVTQNEP